MSTNLFKKAIPGNLQRSHPLHFMLQSVHINLLSLSCCFFFFMVRRGHTRRCTPFLGRFEPGGESHGAQPEDGAKQLIDCISEAYISLDSVSIQPLVNNQQAIA